MSTPEPKAGPSQFIQAQMLLEGKRVTGSIMISSIIMVHPTPSSMNTTMLTLGADEYVQINEPYANFMARLNALGWTRAADELDTFTSTEQPVPNP